MKARFHDRIAAALSVLLLAALAGGSYYLAEISRRMGSVTIDRTLSHEPDSFVEGLVFTRINEHGAPAFRISADHMLHFPFDGSSEYQRPVLTSLDPTKPRMHLVADTGRSTAEGVETHLYDNVVLTREAGFGEPKMTVHTDYVVLYSQTEIARTDRPVRIEREGSVLTGVGMEFDNAARSLTVDSQVRGTWTFAPKTP